ncbi:hypothetical protein L9F63_010486 [Diploptera punctata]|uniref:Uncharacterized protein n=1 Tax=Diploptera punctata TaxID=6984 RepID=A0AAD8AHB0_DIPPU|nr:hypothetical protein L9F63_010486 [Diploptera punctata]
MQLSGDLKPGVSVAAQQGMYFSQQAPPSQPPAPAGDSYSVSQSQTINFTQQSLRQRPTGATGRDPTVVGNRQALEQQHVKLLQQQQQQQQILRAQALQQQQSHMAGMGPRPPPPEYTRQTLS